MKPIHITKGRLEKKLAEMRLTDSTDEVKNWKLNDNFDGLYGVPQKRNNPLPLLPFPAPHPFITISYITTHPTSTSKPKSYMNVLEPI